MLNLEQKGGEKMATVKETKKEVIANFKKHDKDTGSAEVQIALLSERINTLSDHFKKHKKDFHSRRGLLMMVSKRRKLISYLKSVDNDRYKELIKALGLRK